jgi:peptide deformylase
MILPIVNYGHPALRTEGAVISRVTAEIVALAQDMIETMHDAHGVGLAAQQVARPVQLCVIDVRGVKDRPSRLWINGAEVSVDEHMPMILLNPRVELKKPKVSGTEGCLSFPELTAEIVRAERVAVTADTLDGKPLVFECDGLLARAVQHEGDHLRGVLFIDRMDSATKRSLKRDIEGLRDETLAQLKRAGQIR